MAALLVGAAANVWFYARCRRRLPPGEAPTSARYFGVVLFVVNRQSTVAARFWLGMVFPAVAHIVLMLFVVLLAGQGRGFAPFVVFMASLVAIPVAMLANGWLLFVNWRPVPVLLTGLAAPLVIAAAMALWIQSGDGGKRQGTAVLRPFFDLLEIAAKHPLAAFAVWLLATAILVLAAWRRARREARRGTAT